MILSLKYHTVSYPYYPLYNQPANQNLSYRIWSIYSCLSNVSFSWHSHQKDKKEKFENILKTDALHPWNKVPTAHHPLPSLSYNLPCFSFLDSIWPIKPTYKNSSCKFLLIRRFSENLLSNIVNTRPKIFVDSHILQRHKRVLWKLHIILFWLMQPEVFYFHFVEKINSLSLSLSLSLSHG